VQKVGHSKAVFCNRQLAMKRELVFIELEKNSFFNVVYRHLEIIISNGPLLNKPSGGQ